MGGIGKSKDMRMRITAICAVAAIAVYGSNNDSIPDQILDEVTVSATRPQIGSDNGIMSVDLRQIVDNKPVTNILEALPYIPGVTTNGGQIGLAGASAITILVNGEMSDMPAANIYQLLYSLPVDKMDHVEVMYAAPPQYHVNGAVINVILKTPRPLDELQGQVLAGAHHTHYTSAGGAVSATYATRRWSFDLNYDLTNSRTWGHESTESNHLIEGSRHLITDEQSRRSQSLSNSIYASAAYKTDRNSSLKLTYAGHINSHHKARSNAYGTLGEFENRHSYPTPDGFHYATFSYTTSSGMKIGADYTYYHERRNQRMQLMPAGTDIVQSDLSQSINRAHAYIDRSDSIGSWLINYGAEYTYTSDRSQQSYSLPPQQGFDGILRENVADVYVGLQHSFPFGLQASAAIKGEYYHTDLDHNFNIMPQLSATYYRTPTSIFQLSFNTRRIYPSYWELHGGTSYINDYTTVVGNPALKPCINYDGQLSYIFRQRYVATLYMNYADQASVQLPYQQPDRLNLIYQTVNLNYSNTMGLNLHIPVDITDMYNATLTANGFYNRVNADQYHDMSFDRHRLVFYGSLDQTVKPWHNSPVAITVEAAYISPSLQGVASMSGMWRINAGVKWTFARQRAELAFRADDIFNTWSPVMRINHHTQDYRMDIHDMTRTIKLTFTYRFNGFKPKNDKSSIDSSRFGAGNN